MQVPGLSCDLVLGSKWNCWETLCGNRPLDLNACAVRISPWYVTDKQVNHIGWWIRVSMITKRSASTGSEGLALWFNSWFTFLHTGYMTKQYPFYRCWVGGKICWTCVCVRHRACRLHGVTISDSRWRLGCSCLLASGELKDSHQPSWSFFGHSAFSLLSDCKETVSEAKLHQGGEERRWHPQNSDHW